MVDRASLKELEKWYDKEYKERGEDFGVSINAYLQFAPYLGIPLGDPTVPDDEKIPVLDVACGQGYMLDILYTFYNTICYGTEISKEAIKLTKEICPDAIVRKCPAEKIGFSNKMFKHIICIGSLEHFNDIDQSLLEMNRVGDDDCTYCILVPNKSSWWHNHTEQEEINETFYSMKEWSKIFNRNGFKITRIHRDRWHIEKPQSKLKKLLNYLTPKRYFHSLVFILRKDRYGEYQSKIFN